MARSDRDPFGIEDRRDVVRVGVSHGEGDDSGPFKQIGGPIDLDAAQVVESLESVGEQLSFVLGDGVEADLVEEVRGLVQGKDRLGAKDGPEDLKTFGEEG